MYHAYIHRPVDRDGGGYTSSTTNQHGVYLSSMVQKVTCDLEEPQSGLEANTLLNMHLWMRLTEE